jgi:hypothetical protein
MSGYVARMAREFIPEIVTPDIDASRRALKVSCLYFDRTVLQHRTLAARPLVGEQMQADGLKIHYAAHHTQADVDAVLDTLAPLFEAGVLLPAPNGPGIEGCTGTPFEESLTISSTDSGRTGIPTPRRP